MDRIADKLIRVQAMAAKKRPSRLKAKPTRLAQPKEAQTRQERRRYFILFGKNKEGTITPNDITDEMIDLINTLRKMSAGDG
jgi:hypothetical protein